MGKKHFGKRDIDSFRSVIANEREIKRYYAILNLAEIRKHRWKFHFINALSDR